MKINKIKRALCSVLLISSCIAMSACIGSVVGAVVDTTIEVVKVPFKVGGAVIDVVTPDKLDGAGDSGNAQNSYSASDDSAALKSESEGL